MWPQLVQRSVQCSYPGCEGVIRCTAVAPRQRSHRELDRTRGGEGANWSDIFNLPGDCRNLVRRFKLAAKPPLGVAAHGIAHHQGSLGAITSGALESAEFVTRRTGRNASKHRTGLTVRTARTLYGAKRWASWQCMRGGQVRHPFWAGRVHDTLPDTGYRRGDCSPPLVRWSILTTTDDF